MSSGAKTHAFFASSFQNTPAPPPPPLSLSRHPIPDPDYPNSAPPRSLTADFFATPFRSPSPPPLPKPPRSATSSAPISLSRIFPSRHSKARETIADDTTTATTSSSTPSLLFSRPKPKPEFLFFDFDRNRESNKPQPAPDEDDASHLQLLTDGNSHFTRLNTSTLHPSSSPILLSSSASSTSSMYSYPSSHSPSPSRTPSLIDSDSETDTRLPTPPRRPHALPPFSADSVLREDEATPRPPDLLPSLKVTHLLDQITSDDKDKPHASSPEQDADAPLGPGVIISSDPARIIAPSPSAADADAFLSPTVSPLSLTFNLSSSPTQGHFHSPLTSPLFAPPSPLPPASAPAHAHADRDHQQAPSRTGTPTPRSFSSSSAVPNATLKLIKPLGQGAFSSVWLGEDLSRVPLALANRKSVRDLRRAARASGELSRSGSVKSQYKEKDKDEEKKSVSSSLSRNGSLKKFSERIGGTRPPVLLGRKYLDERHGEMGVPSVVIEEQASPAFSSPASLSREGSTSSHGHYHTTASGTTSLKRRRSKAGARLVAVKLTPRRVAAYSFGIGKGGEEWEKEEEERTRVGFVREVEVLRHISHPNITPLLTHLSTPSHHVLVLPYLDGGDLHGLVNNDIAWNKLSESVMRRIWCELCKAVGWMHGVGLVHRDIKLENILLTTTAFSALTESSPRPKISDLPEPPAPFIKLSDFGLSRFVDLDENGDAELLTTRCGSEAYSAPEIIMGGGSRGSKDGRGVYDARETDAWACGIVLYALVARCLPFGEGPGVDTSGRIGDERMGYGAVRRSRAAERRGWLMKIASGQWEWPVVKDDDAVKDEDEEEELIGSKLVLSEGARRIAEKLLVRDPRKRARICELWEDEWMIGGALGVEIHASSAQEEDDDISSDIAVEDEPVLEDAEVAQTVEDEMEFVDEEDEEGLLLDQEGIDNIARREVV